MERLHILIKKCSFDILIELLALFVLNTLTDSKNRVVEVGMTKELNF